MTDPTAAPAECHVVTHVHWDREWYRPFEAFRARLVELAEQVCAELDDGRLGSFHLDGQTIVLADIAALRPDLADRLRSHAAAGRLTIGPWHVLADNQLVSGENLVRNLLAARRWASGANLADVGYSPDAFGHPADLPRVLAGFGMDTALVWRGAPPGVARFRWRSPDGSEVFAVNQAYHAAEVLWPAQHSDGGEDSRVAEFLTAERDRLPGGPWLLMNGGDHLAPSDAAARVADARRAAAAEGVTLRESTLQEFFADARKAAAAHGHPPLHEGELRVPGDRLTFVLPGTLSARVDIKQANAAAQTLLERWVEPALALHAPDDDTLAAELRHAWELLLRNAPHDSICGCSVDAVHRENHVRYERIGQIGEHVLQRALLASGLDTRLYGERPAEETSFAVLNPHGDEHTGPVTVELLTSVGRFPAEVTGPDGLPVPFEAEDLGVETSFEADLELLPDSKPSQRHRLRLRAHRVPALGRRLYRVRLSDAPVEAADPHDSRELVLADGSTAAVADDASLTLTRPDGTVLTGFGRLADGGDSGDTYNYDPPRADSLRTPVVRAVRRTVSPVRTTLEIDAVLTVPRGLTADRSARSAEEVELPLRVSIASWHGEAALRWDVEFDNAAEDHRLRLHLPTRHGTGSWTGDGHYALIERPVTADLGPLPDRPGHEAACASAPVQSAGAIGFGAGRVTVAAPGLPEMRGIPGADEGTEELVVTLLRSVGWLSRFDLRSRTTGAGPMLATPDAQLPGRRTFAFATTLGAQTDLARLAASVRVPLRAAQVRPGTEDRGSAHELGVSGALLTAVKQAEDGRGLIVRVSNPAPEPAEVLVRTPSGTSVEVCRLDETPDATGVRPVVAADGALRWNAAPFSLTTLRLIRA
ncbi:glycosyl hydrolase-related protein [Streptomyces sp. NPDC056405]|uniref:glycoside hydrolase family 38 N-terminal domain-containing protein n=1 Tax=Streptomyces sp. NPDC056405 TaxID=3345811 RepID=UPI0035D61BE4